MRERHDHPSVDAPYFHGRCRCCGREIWRSSPPRAYSDICNGCYRLAALKCDDYNDRAPAQRRLDWTLNECDPDERVVEHGGD